MSMDDQYREMARFRDALDDFNQRLQSSLNALDEHHEAVQPLWQDDMQAEYDQMWSPLHEAIERYAERDAPAYASFIERKLKHLRRYLYGD
jgi:uncharacterized protein YukE